MLGRLKSREKFTLVQSITKNFCFHKCMISKREKLSKEIEESQKNKKTSLRARMKKIESMYDNGGGEDNPDVVKIILWRKYEKDFKNDYFKRGSSIKSTDLETTSYYLLNEFLLYPVTPQTLFKVALAGKYAFKALY